MTTLDYAAIVFRETPWWAFAVLALLVFLGVRRLKTRVRGLGAAFATPAVFGVWGLFNVATYSQAQSAVVGVSTFLLLFAAGWASTRLYMGEAADLTEDGRFLFHGTPEPLITYMAVFAIRFGLEVWKGFEPGAALLAGGIAIGLSAFVAGRTARRAFALLQLRRSTVAA
ncbi:MAG: hypothetical protein M3Q74_12375 [Pseudomonadota bacterium]|nr:hypothetical protein [Pseudomonadota bacterium]